MSDGFALLRLTGFRPKRGFSLDVGGWRVETVCTPRQLLEVLQLRSEVFLSEVHDQGAGTARLDTDVYDLFADHGIVESLKPERHSDALGVTPRPGYLFPRRPPEAAPLDAAASRAQLPPLLRSYLNAGAILHGEPAYDKKFRCAEIVATVLDPIALTRRAPINPSANPRETAVGGY